MYIIQPFREALSISSSATVTLLQHYVTLDSHPTDVSAQSSYSETYFGAVELFFYSWKEIHEELIQKSGVRIFTKKKKNSICLNCSLQIHIAQYVTHILIPCHFQCMKTFHICFPGIRVLIRIHRKQDELLLRDFISPLVALRSAGDKLCNMSAYSSIDIHLSLITTSVTRKPLILQCLVMQLEITAIGLYCIAHRQWIKLQTVLCVVAG